MPKVPGGRSKRPNDRPGDLIELGSRNKAPVASNSRLTISDELPASAGVREECEEFWDKQEEIVSSVLGLWESNHGAERDKVVTEKLEDILTYLYLRAIDPNLYVYTCLAYLSALVPEMFLLPEVVVKLSLVLHSVATLDKGVDPDGFSPVQNPFRKNPSIPVLSCALLFNAHKRKRKWPLSFVQCYIEDAFNARVWVDHDACHLFVANILTSLPHTRSVPSGASLASIVCVTAGLHTGSPQQGDEFVIDRWTDQLKQRVISFIGEMVEFQVSKHKQNVTSFIKTLCSTATVPKSRSIGAVHLNEWFDDLQASRLAKEYLHKLCLETHLSSEQDLEILKTVITLRAKSVPVQFCEWVTQLLSNNPEYPAAALRYFVQKEISASIVNFKLLGAILQAHPKPAEANLALALRELSAASEGFRPLVFMFLRRVARASKTSLDLDLIQLADSLLEATVPPQLVGSRDSWALFISDLTCLCMILCAPFPAHEMKDINKMQDYHFRLATIQRLGIVWCHSVQDCSPIVYLQIIRRMLILDPIESFPFLSENGDANVFQIIQGEAIILQDTVRVILLMAAQARFGLEPQKCLDIVYSVYFRAAALQLRNQSSFEALIITDGAGDFLSRILRLTTTRETLWAPREIFHKACLLLLLISAFNPSSLGALVWENCQTVKQMMEMCVMHRYINSPAERDREQALVERGKRMQNYNAVQQALVSELMASPDQREMLDWINAGKLIYLPPSDVPFEFSRGELQQIERCAAGLFLPKALCASRAPDFLVDIMERQGARLAVSWLLPIVHDDAAALSNLPVSALTHLLVAYIDREMVPQVADDLSLLLRQFRKYLEQAEDPRPTQEISQLLLSELSSAFIPLRGKVKKACSIVFDEVLFSSSPIGSQKDELSRSSGPFSPPISSPVLNKSLTSDLRMSNPISVPELKERLAQSPSYKWLADLSTLRHFDACQDILFQYLRKALEAEDVEEDFLQLLNFLQELCSGNRVRHQQLALSLGAIASGRRVIIERLFQNVEIYKVSTTHLFETLMIAETDCLNLSQDSIRLQAAETNPAVQQSAVQLKENGLILIPELIVGGFANLLSLSCRFKRLLKGFEREFHDLHNSMLEYAFPINFKSNPARFDVKTKQMLPLLTRSNALDLLCSHKPALYERGVNFFHGEDLVKLLRLFGISSNCYKYLLEAVNCIDHSRLEQLCCEMETFEREATRLQLNACAPKGCRILKFFPTDEPMTDNFLDTQTHCDLMEVENLISDGEYQMQLSEHEEVTEATLGKYLNCETPHLVRDQFLRNILDAGHQREESAKKSLRRLASQIKTSCKSICSIYQVPTAFMNLLDALNIALDRPETEKFQNIFAKFLGALSNRIDRSLDDPGFLSLSLQERKSLVALSKFLCGDPQPKRVVSQVQLKDNSEALLEDEIGRLREKTFEEQLEAFLSEKVLECPQTLFSVLLKVLKNTPEEGQCGLVIDCLEACLGVASDDQNKLLFNVTFQTDEDEDPSSQRLLVSWDSSKSPKCPPFTLSLLSMILHRGSWPFMNRCAEFVLKPGRNLLATNALQFLSAFAKHPRSWSSYTATERHTAPLARSQISLPTLSQFSSNQIVQLITLIQREQEEPDHQAVLRERQEFLLSTIRENPDALYPVLLSVLNVNPGSSEGESECLKEIRTLMYLAFPQEVREGGIMEDCDLSLDMKRESKLDLSLHRLLRALLDHNHCEAAYKILCGMALQHRVIFLRYLPIMAALLEGRVHLSAASFVEKSFIRLFTHCLGIMDLLRPDIFESKDFTLLLDCFFPLLANWSSDRNSHLVPLMQQFIHFLSYCALNHAHLLVDNLKTLKRVQRAYPDLPKLQVLIIHIEGGNKESLSPLNALSSAQLGAIRHDLQDWLKIEERESICLLSDPFKPEGDRQAKQHACLKALEDLCNVSAHSPAEAIKFQSQLEMIIRSANAHQEQRGRAYWLLLHCLRFNPASALTIIPAYLRCFTSSSHLVQADALRNAPEFFFYSEGQSGLFLRRLFEMGTAAAPILSAILSQANQL